MHSLVKQAAHLMHPHYVFNVLLGISFYVLKTTPVCCSALFENCTLELREYELLTFLGCIVVMKNRKHSTYKTYISTLCMFAKVLNCVLYFRHNPLLAVLYVIFCLLHLAFFPEPAYSGPDAITYFTGTNIEEEIKSDTRVNWIVEFYTAWSPTCVQFAPIYAELSAKYGLENLRFGKIDVTRYPKVAEKFKISVSSWSKQLPTLMLFQSGKEVLRQPRIDANGKVLAKFLFSQEQVMRYFGLVDLYHKCKQHPLKKKKEKLNAPSDEKEKEE